MLSIIIPHYNRSQVLVSNLHLIDFQKLINYEIIIIDDFSSDSEFDFISNYVNQSELNIKLFKNNKNLGPSYCRNKALLHVTNPFVLFLDSDDLINCEIISNYFKFSDFNKDAYVFHTFSFIDNPNDLNQFDLFTLANFKLFWKKRFYFNPVATSCIISKVEFLLTNKIFFPEKIKKGEDSVFKFLMLLNKPLIELIIPETPFFIWNNQVGSITRTHKKSKRLRNYIEEIKSGIYLFKYILKYPEIGIFTPINRIYRASIKYLILKFKYITYN